MGTISRFGASHGYWIGASTAAARPNGRPQKMDLPMTLKPETNGVEVDVYRGTDGLLEPAREFCLGVVRYLIRQREHISHFN